MSYHASSKKKISLSGLVILLPVFIAIYSIFHQQNEVTTRVVLKHNEGLYFWSDMDKTAIQKVIDLGMQPPQNWKKVVKIRGEYYIEIFDIKTFAALFADRLEYTPFDGGDFQGMFDTVAKDFIEVQTESRTTDQLGVKEVRYDYHIASQLNDSSYDISWWSNNEPVKNCETHRIWVYSGRRGTQQLKKSLLVSLTDLAHGLGVDATFDLNRKDHVFYVEIL